MSKLFSASTKGFHRRLGLDQVQQERHGSDVFLLTWEGEPPTDIDPKFCKLYGYPPQCDTECYRGQCLSLEEPDTHSHSLEEWVHSHPQWFDPDEDLACYKGYDDWFHCSIQRLDGINHHGSIHGQKGRMPPRPNRCGEEGQTPPTTNHGSTNHGCPTPPERKLPLEPTSLISPSKKTTTMTLTKIYPIPTSMTTRTICTLHRVATATKLSVACPKTPSKARVLGARDLCALQQQRRSHLAKCMQ